MRNYYYTAWESREDRIAKGWDKPSINGWVRAQSIDQAEATIRSHGFVRDSITFYTKAQRKNFRNYLEGAITIGI
jgi:hypothetical protein